MPFKPLVELDPVKLENALRNICAIFNPGNIDNECQKIILVVGPLTALMESQAADLTQKGIPAVAISSTSENPDQLLKNLAENKYRVALISPEMAISSKFHSTVLSSELFSNNIISLVIDEAHCISEWGNNDFRPDFSNLHILLGRVQSGLPVIATSATMPKDHPQDTFADLMALFLPDTKGPEDFAQTLIYVQGRTTAEKIQDFLRRNTPEEIAEQAFEFYHRHIDKGQKKVIQDRINDGSLRGIAATDALGMGMDFNRIMRVILWLSPKSFLSLVQRIGRCGRAAELLGEAILYVTSAVYMAYEIELEILKGDLSDAEEDDTDGSVEPPDAPAEGEQVDRDAAVEVEEEVDSGLTSWRAQRHPEERNTSPIRCLSWVAGPGMPINQIYNMRHPDVGFPIQESGYLLFMTGSAGIGHRNIPDMEKHFQGGPERAEFLGDEMDNTVRLLPLILLGPPELGLCRSSRGRGNRGGRNRKVEGEAEAAPWVSGSTGAPGRKTSRDRLDPLLEGRRRVRVSSTVKLPYPAPVGARCCDNCTPALFPVETIKLTGGSQLKSGRRQRAKTSEEVATAVKETLLVLRNTIALREWPDQLILTGKNLMSDLVVEALATRAREITSLETLNQAVRWVWAPKVGLEVVNAIQIRLVEFPDHERLAREEQEREKALTALRAMAKKDLRKKLADIFEQCHEAILSETVSYKDKLVKRCQPFLTLPKSNVKGEGTSMATIRKFSGNAKLVRSAGDYSAL
ncbi:P-loop containing nucleoside triphosphate hydrolase protein [Mycena rosella]|uniref:DNA 3'-5' helicase n=1 Tax=Mycena rosella TaxID=1033263 RepID=A0AAD7DD73_MYCRO|nr:P-loop containing nucleoside triphosphate hydrolase protein [Mycena rosella]